MASIINPEDYSIVWLCPLPIETAAALFMFDEHHEGITNRQHGQTVEYHFGRIGRHNVAIAGFPSGEVGIGKAGAMAEAVARDFKNLELGLLVGIGAAIPSQSRDIRLGDVAVADPVGHCPGVVAYDMVKVVPGDELQKQWMDGTHPLWRSVISKIRARANVRGDTFHRHLKVFDKPEARIFQRPYDPPPLHPTFGNRCRETDGPIVHYGTMLSGSKVIRATDFRDQLKEKYGDPVALEMEAAGVMTSLPVAVVRGISDSADSLKNDEWHARAAAVAAGYAKEMLLQLSPKSPPSK
jgi:nucleoside phosphorylase